MANTSGKDVPEKERALIVRASFEDQGNSVITASVYLFDSGGALVASAPLVKDQARIGVRGTLRGARLFVGPSLDKTERSGPLSLATMEQIKAYEAPFKYRPGTEVFDVGRISDLIWPHWPLCRCRVQGRVVVRKTSPGGVIVEAPVCNARVHICEVDRLWWVIARLPDPDIYRLRDDLIRLVLQPIPWPIPHPDPGPLATLANRVIASKLDKVALNPQPLPPEPPDHVGEHVMAARSASFSPAEAVAFNPQPDPPGDLLQALPQETAFALRSNVATVVRRALLDKIELVRPWICWLPWLHPWFYHCDELRVVTTDDQGHFDTTIWYLCAGDKPDLYFWVDYSIGGSWEPVYKPSIPCHVWWDYPCGTEVTITITDPRVPGCGQTGEVKGKQLVVKTIGPGVSMGEINREPSPANPGADPAKAGTVQPMFSVSYGRESPFGATLEPRVDFGTGLVPAGITHYRWSYRQLGSVLDSDWKAIDAVVERHYREIPAGPMAPTVYKSQKVGPDPAVSGIFYLIEPALPAGGEDWEILNESYDLASAYWDTSVLQGKYELKLELFRKTGTTMTRVDLTTEGVGINQILDPAPLTGPTYIATPADYDRLLVEAGHVVGFRLVAHVDNRPCFGTIDSVTVAPGANDTKCGFLEYAPGASATIVFRASHPGNYASFVFDVVRVATPLPSASAAGLVDAASVNGFGRSGDQFSKAVTVTTLLNEQVVPPETPCIRAAFGEGLHVYALATNGYGRLDGLDAPNAVPPGQIGLRAFAITPA